MKLDIKNKKTQGVIIIAVILVVVALIVYFSVKKKKTTEFTIPGTDTTETPAPGVSPSGVVNVSEVSQVFFPLKFGSKNDYVRVLQKYLVTRAGANILPVYGVDGHFGTETQTALRSVLNVSEVSYDLFRSIV